MLNFLKATNLDNLIKNKKNTINYVVFSLNQEVHIIFYSNNVLYIILV